jgi:hypothetical protein
MAPLRQIAPQLELWPEPLKVAGFEPIHFDLCWLVLTVR